MFDRRCSIDAVRSRSRGRHAMARGDGFVDGCIVPQPGAENAPANAVATMTAMVPTVGRTMPSSMLRRVVLPDPFDQRRGPLVLRHDAV